MAKALTICYKTKKGEEYLAYYNYKTRKEVEEEAKRLNEEKPEKLFNGEKINWNKIDYFFVHEQEEMY